MVYALKKSIITFSAKSTISTITAREIIEKIWKLVWIIFVALYNILK